MRGKRYTEGVRARLRRDATARRPMGSRLVSAGVIAGVLCCSRSRQQPPAGVSYVAMGDSYTSAPGVEPYVPAARRRNADSRN